jgi:gamma-glutamyl:cysteine ligase YbdK (ATP-grasp superfamily)
MRRAKGPAARPSRAWAYRPTIGTGRPRARDHFMVCFGVMENYTDLRHVVRPDPTLEAVEARVCDGRVRVEHTLVLAELLRGDGEEPCELCERRPSSYARQTADRYKSCRRSMGWTASSSILCRDLGEVMSEIVVAAGEV